MVSEKSRERYSYSKLSSFHTCPLGYYYTYIEHKKGVGNCFSSYGGFLHSLMERCAKDELSLWDLAATYENEFNEAVPEEFPTMKFKPTMDLKSKYYEEGLNYCSSFKGFYDCKILEVEGRFNTKIDDWDFTGIIDLLYYDKNGKLVIQDYKTKGSFKNKTEKAEYFRQLYLYCIHIKEKYGRFPDTLKLEMIRQKGAETADKPYKPIEIPFQREGFVEAIHWARDTVKAIRDCWSYYPNVEEFHCNHICNHREYCPYRIDEK